MRNRPGAGVLARGIVGVLCCLLYLIFAFVALAAFEFIPWHDSTGNTLVLIVALWIPVSLISVLEIVLIVASKTIYRPRIMLICLNALFIPLYFALGALYPQGASAALRVIAVLSAVGSLWFAAVLVCAMIKGKV